MVEDQLYRSGQPSELNFPFLEKLGLKSIVWLAPEDPNPRLCVCSLSQVDQRTYERSCSLNFLDDQGIKFYHLGVENAVKSAAPLLPHTT